MPTLLLDPGALATRLQLQGVEETPDGQGGASRSWSTVAALWGKVEPVSALGRELAGQEGQVVTHRIYLRARPDVAVGMRLVKLQRTFRIKAMHDPDESGRYVVCLCEETAP